MAAERFRTVITGVLDALDQGEVGLEDGYAVLTTTARLFRSRALREGVSQDVLAQIDSEALKAGIHLDLALGDLCAEC